MARYRDTACHHPSPTPSAQPLALTGLPLPGTGFAPKNHQLRAREVVFCLCEIFELDLVGEHHWEMVIPSGDAMGMRPHAQPLAWWGAASPGAARPQTTPPPHPPCGTLGLVPLQGFSRPSACLFLQLLFILALLLMSLTSPLVFPQSTSYPHTSLPALWSDRCQVFGGFFPELEA